MTDKNWQLQEGAGIPPRAADACVCNHGRGHAFRNGACRYCGMTKQEIGPAEESPLVVTRNGVPDLHQKAALEEFKTACLAASKTAAAPVLQTIDATLAQRGNRYGDFGGHARITQNIKRAMQDSPNWTGLSDDKKEALEMLAHKVGRILNGDPEYHDSWHDMIGYTKLVADTLEAA